MMASAIEIPITHGGASITFPYIGGIVDIRHNTTSYTYHTGQDRSCESPPDTARIPRTLPKMCHVRRLDCSFCPLISSLSDVLPILGPLGQRWQRDGGSVEEWE